MNVYVNNGRDGSVFVDDTTEYSDGPYTAINVLTATKFEKLEGVGLTGAAHATAGSAKELPAGWYYGLWRAVKAHSGTFVLYNGQKRM